jgi:hypothetical protein
VRRELSEGELIAALAAWGDRPVAVRVVGPTDELIGVFSGRLGERTDAKHPSLFWPLRCSDEMSTVEQAGVYLHPGLVEHAAMHTGDTVVEWRQTGVTLNVRRL